MLRSLCSTWPGHSAGLFYVWCSVAERGDASRSYRSIETLFRAGIAGDQKPIVHALEHLPILLSPRAYASAGSVLP
jgi:hypothetical protein